jgi:hypothetical protein
MCVNVLNDPLFKSYYDSGIQFFEFCIIFENEF